MKINGYGMRDHIRFLSPLFGLIGAPWVLRFIVFAAGAPAIVAWLASVQGIAAVSLVLAVFLIHFRGFGGYKNVIVCSFMLNAWTQILIIAAILFAVYTGTENAFTRPEFSLGEDPGHLRHMKGHLTGGIGVGTLISAVLGSALLWLLRKVLPKKSRDVPHVS